MILRPAPVSTYQFTFDRATKTFTGEISSTHGFGRVWDDACDEGMTLVSPSGNEVVFAVDRTERDDDGDVIAWTLRPADRSKPLLADLVLRLFND